jgi:hypothetical protein
VLEKGFQKKWLDCLQDKTFGEKLLKTIRAPCPDRISAIYLSTNLLFMMLPLDHPRFRTLKTLYGAVF